MRRGKEAGFKCILYTQTPVDNIRPFFFSLSLPLSACYYSETRFVNDLQKHTRALVHSNIPTVCFFFFFFSSEPTVLFVEKDVDKCYIVKFFNDISFERKKKVKKYVMKYNPVGHTCLNNFETFVNLRRLIHLSHIWWLCIIINVSTSIFPCFCLPLIKRSISYAYVSVCTVYSITKCCSTLWGSCFFSLDKTLADVWNYLKYDMYVQRRLQTSVKQNKLRTSAHRN